MPGLELFQEADRQLTICNACRYCEGICPVFPAIEARKGFTKGDMRYFANLCHDCHDLLFGLHVHPSARIRH